jgi:hypothetical protein
MPNIDISRDATDLRKHYQAVHMQQGRVLTDDDFNEAARLEGEDARRVRADVIGPAGSPDDGFKLKVVAGQLTLSAGTYYVSGLRLELENDEAFNVQRDWLQQGARPGETLVSPNNERYDFVWLDVWQQPVTGVEDKELLEAALGGADTSARIRTMRRARALTNVGSIDCAAAWTQLLASLNAQGAVNGDFELVPNATLAVGPDGTAGSSDLCSPPVNGGYLGAENQAIRVQIVGQNQFTWGFDNASPIYRVKLLADNAGVLRRIHMLTVPKDQAHYPLEGQVVELLPWSALLQNGQKNAEMSGFLAKVNGGYNPDTQDLLIDTAPGNDTGNPPMPFGQRWTARADQAAIANEAAPEDTYFYMRVWNRGAETASPARINFVPGVAVPLAMTGLQVTFNGANLRPQDFWIIAARPETPNRLVPWEFSAGRTPHGVRRWIAPLGVIHWPGGAAAVEVVDDCRPTFLPLTRMKGCCTYTVGDGTHSYGNFSRIQDAVQALPPSGGQLCVLAGVFNESVRIDQRVAIRIHGCGSRSRVRAGVDANNNPLPGFMISNSTAIGIEDLAIESGPRSAVEIQNARHVEVQRCLIQMRDVATLWQAIFSRADDVLIESNVIEVLPANGVPPASAVPPAQGAAGAPAGLNTPPDAVTVAAATRGGIQLGGGSDRVSIVKNTIRGGIWNGITLGSLVQVGAPDRDHDLPDLPTAQDPCFPCRPVDLGGEDGGGGGNVRFESAGDLYDIRITGNVISDMGINGIGVVRFFDLANGGDLVGVHGLHIVDNVITRCMRRLQAPVTQAMQYLIGYGGIALAKVSDLRVLGNQILANGQDHLQPICGLFAIFVQGLQVDGNRILDNGARTSQPASNAQNGMRGGIHIWVVLPTIEQAAGSFTSSTHISRRSARNGVTTAAVRDNIIVAPLGRAVTFFAAGAVVVSRNRLVTQGTLGRGLDLLAATVLIGNAGLSNEWTVGLLYVFLILLRGKTSGRMCELAKIVGLINPQPLGFWPPLVSRWTAGKTLVSQNQITLDLIDEPLGFGISSVSIFSLDDLGMTDNQNEITTTAMFFYSANILLAGSVRVTDNRFSESWRHAALSGISVGLMNITTENESTHCIRALAPSGMKIFKDNLAFINIFCRGECGGALD